MYTDNFFFALTLTALAGLSTGIGSIIVFFTRHLNSRILACSLGISAGVMIYVSFMEMMPEAIAALIPSYGEKMAEVIVVMLFFAGIGLVALIDRLVPKWQNPHEIGNAKLLESPDALADTKLLRLGIFSAVVIALHNFPEGMATFMSALKNPEVGIGVALAIAIHNIPEGIAVAAPIYFATRKKTSALLLSFGSGLAEILGALV